MSYAQHLVLKKWWASFPRPLGWDLTRCCASDKCTSQITVPRLPLPASHLRWRGDPPQLPLALSGEKRARCALLVMGEDPRAHPLSTASPSAAGSFPTPSPRSSLSPQLPQFPFLPLEMQHLGIFPSTPWLLSFSFLAWSKGCPSSQTDALPRAPPSTGPCPPTLLPPFGSFQTSKCCALGQGELISVLGAFCTVSLSGKFKTRTSFLTAWP